MSPTHALLGLLLSGERHGYDLKREIDKEFAPIWRIDFAQLYRSLAKLTRAGLVRFRTEPGDGGPDRKIYVVTAQGRAAFAAWIKEPAADNIEFLVKVRLALATGNNTNEMIQDRRRVLDRENADRLEAYRNARERSGAGGVVFANVALQETLASLEAVEICDAVAPGTTTRSGSTPPLNQLTITGSDDPLLGRLVRFTHATSHVVGSLTGLLALSRRETDVAGTHLLDMETGEYNIPFVKHLVSEGDTVVVNLAFRENGLLLASGNPKNIVKLRDLTNPGVRLINRSRGTGTRLLLYSRLRAARVDPHSLEGWERTAANHESVAAAIATGAADAGPGLRAIAEEWGLEFIPLGEERYDLVFARNVFESARGRAFLEAIHSKEFRHAAAAFTGYDLTQSGRIIARIKS